MKKVIGRIFLGIFAVFLIGAVALGVYLFGPEKPSADVKPTVKDSDGKSYLAVVDDGGVTYAVVTDANGNRWAANFENGNVGSTVVNVNDKIEASDVLTEYSGPKIEESRNPNDFTGSVDVDTSNVKTTTAPTTAGTTASSNTNTTSAKPGQTTQPPALQNTTVVPTNTQTSEFKIDKYRQIFSSNTYLMEFTTNDKDLGDTPITCASKNGNLLIDTKIEGISCKMLFRADKGKTYLLLDNYRKYSEIPQSVLGDDFSMESLNVMSNFGGGATDKEIVKSKVTIGGKQLDCESYTNSEGTEMRYYFDGDSLVRLDSIPKDGEVSSTYISKLTTDVPDSTFEIPKNYGHINLSWLGLIA